MEIELDEQIAKTKVLGGVIIVICMMQATVAVDVPKDEFGRDQVWEAWGMPGQRERLGEHAARVLEELAAEYGLEDL